MSMPIPGQTVSKEKLTAKELTEFMNHHGISITELAEILGVSFQAVKLWLTGQRKISNTNSRLVKMFQKYPHLIREF